MNETVVPLNLNFKDYSFRYLANTISSMNALFGLLGTIILLNDPTKIFLAARLLVWGEICDILDGRIARRTRLKSELGPKLDNIGDTMTFVLLPSTMLYAAMRDEWFAVLIAGLYMGAGLFRLVRYSTISSKFTEFQGMPVSVPAFLIMSLLVNPLFAPWDMALSSLIFTLLMFSNLAYPSLKGKKSFFDYFFAIPTITIVGLMAIVSDEWIVNLSWYMFSIMAYYAVAGPFIEKMHKKSLYAEKETSD
ncbi:MAG: CDP-alcohol phosphatidyltransferase family protein [Candidatus Kariarchaeaceae archaeon]